ncbi:MAG: HDOD domain-containing protein [Planctomycetota bacterium]
MNLKIKPREIDTLTPMPVSVVQLARMAGDPHMHVSDLAQVIEYDEALTANLLRLANSTWFIGMEPIMTVKEAVVRMGTAQILKMVVGRHLAGPMSTAIPGYDLAEHEHWRHSVAAALAAEHLSSLLFKPMPGLAFTVSLMHDIGKLILGRRLGSDIVSQIHRAVKEEQISFVEAERLIMGTNHAEMGAEIARYWKFPEPMINAIELHHDPDVQPDALIDLVHIGNIVARLMGVGLGCEELHLKTSQQAPKRLGVSPANLEQVCAKVLLELDRADELLTGQVPV